MTMTMMMETMMHIRIIHSYRHANTQTHNKDINNE